jgi:hypothetical protein
MSVTLCAMTDADTADVDGWVRRCEVDLGAVAVEAPQRVVETSSAVLLHTSLRAGGSVVPVTLTVYRDHGRVRVDLRDDAGSLENWLLDALELTVAARLV